VFGIYLVGRRSGMELKGEGRIGLPIQSGKFRLEQILQTL
jgi:hypothetical protein